MRRPNPYLGFVRDVGLIYLLLWSIGHGVAWKFWLAVTLCFACIAYDVRLMWIDAGEKLKGRR